MTSLLHTIVLSTTLSTGIVAALPVAFAAETNGRATNTLPESGVSTMADLQKQSTQRRPGTATDRATTSAPAAPYQFDVPMNGAGQRIDNAGIPLLEDRSLDAG
jgi:hypothetical protein